MEVIAVCAGATAPTIAAVWWALRHRLAVITVEGVSIMTPVFQPGDRLLLARRPGAAVRVGQVVVVERPELGHGWRRPPPSDARSPRNPLTGRRRLVKNVVAVPGEAVPAVIRAKLGLPDDARVGPGELMLLGEQANSEDSKLWGGFPMERVPGVVIRRQ